MKAIAARFGEPAGDVAEAWPTATASGEVSWTAGLPFASPKRFWTKICFAPVRVLVNAILSVSAQRPSTRPVRQALAGPAHAGPAPMEQSSCGFIVALLSRVCASRLVGSFLKEAFRRRGTTFHESFLAGAPPAAARRAR